MRVLVVDDYKDMTDSEVMLFGLWRHEVSVARDGPEALEAALKHAPDLVLLDIDLPRMDGWEVARRLREHDGMKDVLLLAVSGFGQDKDLRRSQESGFDFHFLKPVNPATLKDLLEIFESVAKKRADLKQRVTAEGFIDPRYCLNGNYAVHNSAGAEANGRAGASPA